MKAETTWSKERYRPAVHGDDDIYICRVVPAPHEIRLFWKFDHEAVFEVRWRKKGETTAWDVQRVSTFFALISNLPEGIDYEFYVSSDTASSSVGYARTGWVPGIVVNYLHPEDLKYAFSGHHLCSPCLLKHPDGYLLASMDLYEGKAPQNLTLIFRSDDQGETWYHYSELFPCFWGSLFIHRGDVYMLGVSTEYGDILIGKSLDGGKTFGMPTVLFRGSCHCAVPGWHRAPMPIIEAYGQIWTGIDYGSHASGTHANCLLSADANMDILTPNAWTMSAPLTYDPGWNGAVCGDNRGFIEGNAVLLPDGRVGNILRYFTDKGIPPYGLVPILCGNTKCPEKKLKFEAFAEFPGNLSKFHILQDPIGKRYYSIASRVYDSEKTYCRNLLSLLVSDDLLHWDVVCDLLDYRHQEDRTIGFQYVSFIFDGDDILFLSRTAFNGAQSYHDNNYVTFHRIQNFRRQFL